MTSVESAPKSINIETGSRLYEFEAVSVFCGGIQQHENRYSPTLYSQSDADGMLGGRMRVIAAVGLYLEGRTNTFIFSGGRTRPVNVDKMDDNTPSEASVYKETFLLYLERYKTHPTYKSIVKDLESPEFVLDEIATNTEGNIKATLEIFKDRKLSRAGILSSMYHTPRIKTMFVKSEDILTIEKPAILKILSAEPTAGRAFNWRNLAAFKFAHMKYRERIEVELAGREALHRNRYSSRK